MANRTKLHKLLKAPAELGLKSTWQYALYQCGLRSGFFRLRTLSPKIDLIQDHLPQTPKSILSLPDKQALRKVLGESCPALLQEATTVTQGKMRLFEGTLVDFSLQHHAPLVHWSRFERGKTGVDEDIKFVWEPARAGWAFLLARAFFVSGDDSYTQSFVRLFEQYQHENPPYYGPNWASAQEAALRIMAFCFAYHVFSTSPDFPERSRRDLILAIALNARRIPPTLCYARSQRNNHLISEAVGLYTAGVFLEGYPPARRWKRMGKKIFEQAILDQIAQDGTYIQHSTNYHRLMLDEALWMHSLAKADGDSFSQPVLQKLAAATGYLCQMSDSLTGQVPNLGNQDGSNVLPLATAHHLDHRATLQAASRVFLGKNAFEDGTWDEKSVWLHIQPQTASLGVLGCPCILHSPAGWASLRAVSYHSRPAHADQLHVEIWHNGHNLAMDAGTFLYNAPQPWQNALRTTLVHNTVSVDRTDQMTAAGKFLWLDWANAEVSASTPDRIVASHDGYRNKGIIHTRTLTSAQDGWNILDELHQEKNRMTEHEYMLHWLLPDLPFEVQSDHIQFQVPAFQLFFTSSEQSQTHLTVIRGGQILYGDAILDPLLFGWFSPTYGMKTEALSLLYIVHSSLPLTSITSVWKFLD